MDDQEARAVASAAIERITGLMTALRAVRDLTEPSDLDRAAMALRACILFINDFADARDEGLSIPLEKLMDALVDHARGVANVPLLDVPRREGKPPRRMNEMDATKAGVAALEAAMTAGSGEPEAATVVAAEMKRLGWARGAQHDIAKKLVALRSDALRPDRGRPELRAILEALRQERARRGNPPVSPDAWKAVLHAVAGQAPTKAR